MICADRLSFYCVDVLTIHSYQQNNTVLTYSDVFRNLIRPKLTERADDWDNGSEQEVRNGGSSMTIFECAERCAEEPLCRQYSLNSEGTCKTSGFSLRGGASPGTQSGAMLWRVDAAMEYYGRCPEPKWVTA